MSLRRFVPWVVGLIVLAASFIFGSITFAGAASSIGSVSGSVHDIDTQAAIGDVAVDVEVPQSRGAYPDKVVKSIRTDSKGFFSIEGLASGEYGLKFSKLGYRVSINYVHICFDATLLFDATLQSLESTIAHDRIPNAPTYLSGGHTLHKCPDRKP